MLRTRKRASHYEYLDAGRGKGEDIPKKLDNTLH